MGILTMSCRIVSHGHAHLRKLQNEGVPPNTGSFAENGGILTGFTLLELLTAMAVLAMILVMMLQVVNGILQSTKTQNQQMDSVGAARRMLDVMESDLRQAIVGENAAVLVNANSPGLAFLTDRRGPAGSTGHRFLAVRYALTNSTQFSRSYGSVGFTNTDLLAGALATSTNSVLADGILGFQIRVKSDSTNRVSTSAPSANWSTNSYNGASTPTGWNALITGSPSFATGLTNRAQSLQIWVAAVDKQSLQLVDIASAQAAFGADPTAWQANVDASSLPAPVKSSIRILTKTLALP